MKSCAFAQARLAFLKTHGRPHIKINHQEARKWQAACGANNSIATAWIHRAALAEISAAQFCLALCYYNGIGVKENDQLAFEWCEKAAINGHAGAQNVLGNLYID